MRFAGALRGCGRRVFARRTGRVKRLLFSLALSRAGTSLEVLNMADPQFPPINVPGTGKLYARLHTTQGPIVVELEEQRAPKTVANFVGLATGTMTWTDEPTGKTMEGQPLYAGVRFHRVIPGFMVQCGDPLTRHADMARRWGTGGPGYRFSDEFHK